MSELKDGLQRVFGLQEFRPLQEDVCRAVMAGAYMMFSCSAFASGSTTGLADLSLTLTYPWVLPFPNSSLVN